jgi:hypothetical protein
MIAVVGGLAVAACGNLWMMIGGGSWGWSLGAGAYTALLVVALIGMWHGKCGALRLSRALAAILFGFGCWAAYFAWTIWFFQEPTLTDRILAVADPEISAYLILPALWFFLGGLPRIRERFKS